MLSPSARLRINSARHTALGVGASVSNTVWETLRSQRALPQGDISEDFAQALLQPSQGLAGLAMTAK